MAEAYIQSSGQERAEETGNQYFDDLLARYFFQSSNVQEEEIYRMNDFFFHGLESGNQYFDDLVRSIQSSNVDREGNIDLAHDLEFGNPHIDNFVRTCFKSSQVKREERYRMHDLIHDLAVSISKPYFCQSKDIDLSTSQNTRHVSLLCEDVEKPTLGVIGKSEKLRTLLFPTNYLKKFGQTLDKMIRILRFMRVLDLSSSTIQELPESVKELKLLRYLNLSKTESKVLPNSICSLYHLETLKLIRCLWVFELPKDLRNLINLRYLELDEMFWYKASTLPPRIGSLINLENLHAFQVGRGSGYGINELKDMVYLTEALHISKLENVVNARDAKLKEKERLQKLAFEWSDGDIGDDAAEVRVLEDLQPHSNIKELQICYYRGSTFPAWMQDGQFQNLVSISLKHCTKCRSLSLGQLPQLGQLSIKGMEGLEEWTDVDCPYLYILQNLSISNCPKLRNLPHVFPKLRVLKIKKCNSLRSLPVTFSLKFAILVDNLALEDWNEASIIQRAIKNDESQVVIPSLNNLLELKMICCPKMQKLPEVLFPQKTGDKWV